MKLFRSKYIVILFFGLANLASCNKDGGQNDSRVEELPYFDEASFTPQWINADSNSLNDFHVIPAFSLINQDGDSISQKSLEGKIYVANFFFTTCPGICPQMSDNMGILQEEFMDDDEVMLISHSVTPDRDTVEKLAGYANKRGIKSKKWYLLTGDRQQIYDLGRGAYFIEENMGIEKTVDDFLHTENFVLIDKNKHIRGIYNGLNKTSVNQLIADIKTLEEES
ncbi:SCO family protein [Arcticibacterium luteifluviistationis]|uniref:SCO family protein n=1 Tax=Arcticibacterium luteifluviistationis TaxID=1784714 RepID=A0A2Z4GIK7_9BACT|nr:SCO family protein [Arcticibacterium luteifluviistationis]AWW00938.1 SCO family protein [Arcticibacterium luteifluviistationis]